MSEPAELAHPTPGRPARRRWRLIATAVTSAAVLLLVPGALAVYLLPLSGDEPVTYKVDQRVVKDWNQKLAPALADLNALSNIPGLKPADPARVSSCSVDSGELFDLHAGRYWDATDPGRTVEYPPATVTPTTAHAFLEVIRHLRTAGWRVAATSDNLGMDLPRGLTYDTVDLNRTTSGVKTNLYLQVFDDGLLAGLDFEGAKKACGGH
jgi:hypothetical protein